MQINIDASFLIGFFGTYLIGSIIFAFASETDFNSKEESKYIPPVDSCLNIPDPINLGCEDHPITNANSSSEGL